MNERLRKIRKALGLSMEEFGGKLGVTRAAISNIENGNRSITKQMAISICREYNVNPYWLETGEGEMFVKPSYNDMDFAEDLLKPENKMYLDLFKACKEVFSEDDWKDVMNFIEMSYKIIDKMKSANKDDTQ